MFEIVNTPTDAPTEAGGRAPGEGEPRRLILGSEPRGAEGDVHPWGALPDDLDVADYDEVLVNLGDRDSDGPPIVLDGDPLALIDQLARLLLSEGGDLTLVGNPDSPIETSDGPVPFSSLLPLRLEVQRSSGRRVRVVDERFAPYLEQVAAWSFVLTGRCQVAEDALEASGAAADLSVDLASLADDADGRSIAVTARVEVKDADGARVAGSRLTVLPAPTETDVADAIGRLLAARREEATEDRPAPSAEPATQTSGQAAPRDEEVPGPEEIPDWVDDVRLPAEAAVRDEIRELTEEIERLERKREEVREQLRGEGYLKRLLYDEGAGLLRVVGDAFARLGATIEAEDLQGDPDEDEPPSVRLAAPDGRRAMVIAVGTPDAVDVEKVRDADRLVRDAIALEGWEGHGVVVANARAEAAPGDRDPFFTDDAVELARRFEVTLLRSDQLFAAVRDAQAASFDRERFWEAVAGGEGTVDLPGLA